MNPQNDFSQRFVEHTTILVSIAKWTVYATVVGLLVGASTTIFLRSLAWATAVFARIPMYFLLLPVTLLAAYLLVRWLAPDAAGHGTERVIAAIHQRAGRIKLAVVPVKLVATVITLASGGSAGKEGPCAQIGAALASAFGGVLKLSDEDRRKLVICGVSAGFASVFGTPIAGALFGVEVLFLGQMLYSVLFPSLVAGLTSYYVSSLLGITYFSLPIESFPRFSEPLLLQTILIGLICGLVAYLLIGCMNAAHRFFDRLPWSKALNPILGGGIVALIGVLVSPRYLGLGLESVEDALHGGMLPRAAFLWKIAATSITLGCGGSGGILTPIFFIGASVGNTFAFLWGGEYYATFTAIGMVALLAGAANTPIAASVMAIEMFGPAVGPYAALAAVVSFLMVGHHSVYPSQVLAIRKSATLAVATGRPVSEIEANVLLTPRRRTLMVLLMGWWRDLRGRPHVEECQDESPEKRGE